MKMVFLGLLAAFSLNANAAFIYEVSWSNEATTGSGTLTFPALSGTSTTADDDVLFNFSWTFLGEELTATNGVFGDFLEATWEIVDGALNLTNFELFTTTNFVQSEQYWYLSFAQNAGQFRVFCEDGAAFTGCGGIPGPDPRLTSIVEPVFTEQTASVPEPASWALLLGGLALVGLRRVNT